MRRDRLYQRFGDHPDVVDAAIAVGLFVLLGLPVGLLGTGGDVVRMLCSAAILGPLAVRRRYPVAAGAAVQGGSLAFWLGAALLGEDPYLPAYTGVLVALYTLAAHGTRSASRLGLGAGLIGSVLVVLPVGAPPAGTPPDAPEAPPLLPLLAFGIVAASVVVAWTLGDSRRVRRAYVAQLEERARRLEVEREQEARLAASTERARIAREMHDVVAHSLAVMIAQADGGRYATEDAVARGSLATVAATGRAALADMRRLLGVLRSGGDDGAPPVTAPQPDVALIPDLVDGVRHSGVAVDLEQVGEPRPLPAAAGLAAYRIVQEALTNVLKHAGPGARTTVAVDWAADALELRVDDDGAGAVPAYPRAGGAAVDGSGHGLAGMRERAVLFGGSLSAGPRPDGGFRVDVRLPYPAGAR